MTNSSPPNPSDSSSENSKLSEMSQKKDEWIGVIVAFAVIGTVLLSSFGTKFDWKNAFSQREGGLFSFLNNTEDTKLNLNDTKLDLELDSDSTIEEKKLTANSSLTKPKTTSTSLPILNVPEKEAQRRTNRRINNLIPLAIPGETPDPSLITKTEAEIPDPPLITKTETETPDPPLITKTEAETPDPPLIAETKPQESKLVFEDVPKTHWAYPFIQPLGKENFIVADNGNNFEPDKPITRAGMADLVSHAFKNNPEKFPTKNFNDVSPNSKRFSDINKAVKIGFMNGYSDDKFHPELEIPRYQVLVALATGLKLNSSGNPNNTLRKFSDRNQMPDWAKKKVAAAIQSSIVVNRPGFDFSSLKPNEPATRAEVAAMIYQTLVKDDKLDSIESTYIVPKP